MIRTFALIVSIVIAASAPAQDPQTGSGRPKLVTVSSRGTDVRAVLHDMFKQSGKSFVLEPNIRFFLYLSLESVEFEEALSLVCKMASLKVEVQNGIYFINKPAAPVKPSAVKAAFETKPAPKGRLPESVLNKKVTTRFDKIDFRLLLSNLTQQTGVQFEIAPNVPNFKLDAYLIGTSLKFGLDRICKAAKLKYDFTEDLTIAITRAEPANRVAIVGGT